MFERLLKGFFVTLILPLVALGMAYLAWDRNYWGPAGLAVVSGAVALFLGQWMWWVDRLLPGVDRVKAADRLFQLCWFLPLLNVLAIAIAENTEVLREKPALTSLLHIGFVAIGVLLVYFRLRPTFAGPPRSEELAYAMQLLHMVEDRRGPFRRPMSKGEVGGLPLEITWANDANGSRFLTAVVAAPDVGLTGAVRGMFVFTPGVTTGDPALDSVLKVEGDAALARALLTADVRARFAAAATEGAALGPSGWRYEGRLPQDPRFLFDRMAQAAACVRPLSVRGIDAALESNAVDDPIADVRLGCLFELMRRGKEAPVASLKDDDPRVRVLAAAMLAPARMHPAATLLLTEPAGIAAGLLDACWEHTAVAFVLVSAISERGGPSATRALEHLMHRTKDEALKTAAREAIERCKARGETDSGRLSVSDDSGGSVSIATGQGAVSIKK